MESSASLGGADDPCFRRKDNTLKSRVSEYKTIFYKIKICPTLLLILISSWRPLS